jgi:hypothetical protein
MHGGGVNHRDFYICHFLLHLPVDAGAPRLSLIDLHRAQVREQTPRRWRDKDLAALYFSALDIGLTRRDGLRFLQDLFRRPLRDILRDESVLLAASGKRIGPPHGTLPAQICAGGRGMNQATDWRLLPDVDPAAAARFADLDCVFALEGEIVARDSMTRTLRVEINGRRYYVKRYAGLGKKPLRRWLATPRVQLEWENLGHFADWGIPTAHLVGYGLESQGGRFLRGALITAEIPGTTDLGWLARTATRA